MPGTSHLFSRETSVLCAGETLACFLLFYLLLTFCLAQPSTAAIDHAAVYAITFGATALAAGIYRAQTRRRPWLPMGRAILAACLSLPVVCLTFYLVPIRHASVLGNVTAQPVTILVCWIALIFFTRIVFGLLLQSPRFGRRVVVLGSSTATSWIRSDQGCFYDVLPGPFDADAASADPITTDALDPALLVRRRIWAIVVDDAAAATLGEAALERVRRVGIRVLRDTVFLESCLNRIDPASTHGRAPAWSARPVFDVAARVADTMFAVTLLLLALPVMLLVAVAMKLEDHGPVLFRQLRVGLGGREFTLCKFRSMRLDAEACGPVWAQQRDPRVTRVGGWLRRTHLDELPQLFNILRGEMSVVGPRPERLHFVQQICRDVPGFAQRALVKPGLTGWAQVNYPYGASIEDAAAKLSYDLYYVRHRGMLLYMMTLLATVRVVLFQEGSR